MARIALPAALAVVLFAASLWLFYPGLVSYDSIAQFREAETGRFTTVHPPLMAATWRLLLPLGPGGVPILVMNLLLYWGSFFALALYGMRASGRPWAPFAILAGLWPLLLSFSGVIWKDVVLAAAWGLSCALMLLLAQDREPTARFWAAWVAAAALLLFGSVMRHNAAPAAIVLAIALAVMLPRRLARTVAFVGLSIIAVMAVPMSSRLLHATDSHPIEYVVSWDLTGISFFSGRDYRDRAPDHEARLACYSPRLFDACPLVAFGSPAEASSRWRQAVATEPVAYLKHRALVFSMLMRFGCVQCRPYIWEWGNRSAEPELGYRPNAARTALSYVVRAIGFTPLGRPYVWLAAAILFCAMLWRRRFAPNWWLLAHISLSGAVYALGYSAVAVTDEFRYLYWTIYAVVLTGTAFLMTADWRIRDLLRWIVGPLVLLVIVDFTVQALWPTDRIAPSMATNY